MADNFSAALQDIEQRWQERWAEDDVFRVEEKAEDKYYVLEMFPYPSGNLHMGHVRNFSLGDVVARYKRMQGFNVLHPMGWDAFGLPAENAAIERDIKPGEWTFECIENMRGQLQRLGFSYDWEREIATCTPEYYAWNQWLFLQLLEDGLAYQDEATVNWCPGCETVLADEQVEDGLCWRCDSVVAEEQMTQWFLRITNYADDLLQDLDRLDGWPEKVRKMQHDWIGKSTGAEVHFPVKDTDTNIEVFTTRPDTIFGATYMVLAPEHPFADVVAEENEDVAAYIDAATQRSTAEREEKNKSGVFTGHYAVNPFTDEELPIYVAEFVLTDYGTGAIMAVPAHDSRDHAFAQEHGLDIQPVVEPDEEWDFDEAAYEGDGVHVNSGPIDGMDNEAAIQSIIDIIEDDGRGKAAVNYRLRDWLISRQRYWGTPIPVVYCESCGVVPVPAEELPVELPEDVTFTGEGNPIETADEWLETSCPDCGGDAERETDTMDTFVDSSWYFLRYADPENMDLPFDSDAANYWMNVDQYIGGIEHAVLHLMYARFFTKFLRDIDMVDSVEPFERLLTQGMVLHPAYKTVDGQWLYPEEVETYDGELAVDGEVMKMSKSKHNVVDPMQMIEEYGADTARLFIVQAARPEKELEWSDDGVDAAFRMLERVHRLTTTYKDLLTDTAPTLEDASLIDRIVASHVQRTVEEATRYMDDFAFNRAVDQLDKLLTRLYWYVERDPDPTIYSYGLRRLLEMLSPFAPHLCDELWEVIGEDGYLIDAGWPEVEPALLDEEAERIDQYHDRVAHDIREISDLVDGDVDEITVIQAAPWKYVVGDIIREELERGKDVGALMGAVMGRIDDALTRHGETISGIVQDAAKNPGRFQDQFMAEELEQDALTANRERWGAAFDAEIVVEAEQESGHDKAGRARPGKPAIVVR